MSDVQIPLFSKPRKTTPKIPLRELVLKAIAELGPISDEDLIRKMRKPANSVRPRRVELVNMGLIVGKREELVVGRRPRTLWSVPRDAEVSG